jgi:hypothetical protein
MKGIYLTEEGKRNIEAKITEFEKIAEEELFNEHIIHTFLIQRDMLVKILESATLLNKD